MSNDLWNLRDSTRQSRNWIFYGTSETCLSETGKSKISLSRDIPRVDRISREVQSDLEKRIDSKKKKSTDGRALSSALLQAQFAQFWHL